MPCHLSEHDRRASRVDVDAIYADSPIDTSLFSLYLHQNYTQFCNEVEEVDGVADWLSWVDSSGGEAVRLSQQSAEKLYPNALHSQTVVSIKPSPVPPRHTRDDALAPFSRSKTISESVQARILRDAQEREGRSGWREAGSGLDRGRRHEAGTYALPSSTPPRYQTDIAAHRTLVRGV